MSVSARGSGRLRAGSHIPRRSFNVYTFEVGDLSIQPALHTCGEPVKSPEWSAADGSRWQLLFYPNGFSERQVGFVSMEMVLLSKAELVATFTISVLAHKGTKAESSFKVKSPSTLNFDGSTRNSWSVDNFLPIDELKSRFVADDTVIFSCEVEVLGPPEILTTLMPPYLGHTTLLSEDFGTLLEEIDLPTAPTTTGNFSDITLVFGGAGGSPVRKFRAHKAILAARSATMKRKLASQSFNAKLFLRGGVYYLEEADPDVYATLLTFLYTDDVSSEFLATRASDLLVAAARMQVPRLIQICEDYLGEGLTPRTVVETLNLAYELKLERLDACCSEFIAAHAHSVMATHTMHLLRTDTLKQLMDRELVPANLWLLTSAPQSPEATQPDVKPDVKVDVKVSGKQAPKVVKIEQEKVDKSIKEKATMSPLQHEEEEKDDQVEVEEDRDHDEIPLPVRGSSQKGLLSS